MLISILQLFLSICLSLGSLGNARSGVSEQERVWRHGFIEAVTVGDSEAVRKHLETGNSLGAVALELALEQPHPDPTIVRMIMGQLGKVPATRAVVDGLLDWAEQLQSPEFLQEAFDRGLDHQQLMEGKQYDAWMLVHPQKHSIAVEWLLSGEAPFQATGSFLTSALVNGDVEIIRDFFARGRTLSELADLVPFPLVIAASGSTHPKDNDRAVMSLLLDRGADINQVRSGDGETALFQAIDRGALSRARWLLEKGALSSSVTKKGETLLHAMAMSSSYDEEMLMRFIVQGVDINAFTQEGKTALHIALEEGQIDLATALIDLEAVVPPSMLTLLMESTRFPLHPDSFDKYVQLLQFALANSSEEKESLIHRALAVGHPQFLDALALASAHGDKGIDLNSRNAEGETPLQVALKLQRESFLRPLLRLGADPQQAAIPEPKLLSIALEEALPRIIERYLTDHSLKELEQVVDHPLHRLMSGSPQAETGRRELIAILVAHGANFDVQDPATGLTPLLQGVLSGNFESARYLVKLGADVRQRSKYGENLFHLLARCRWVDETFLDFLLQEGFALSDVDEKGNSALWRALYEKNVKTAHLFFQRGANIHLLDSGKSSLLHWLTQIPLEPLPEVEREAYLELLSVAIEHYDDMRGSVVAVIAGNGNIAAMEHAIAALKASGSKVDFNSQGKAGLAPLHLAVTGTHRTMVSWLLDHGANPRLQDHAGSTPLHVAYRVGAVGTARDLTTFDRSLQHIEDSERKVPADYDCSNAGTLTNLLKTLSHTWELKGQVKIAYYSAQLEGAFGEMFLPYLSEGLKGFVTHYPGLVSERQHSVMTAFVGNAINFISHQDTLGRAPAGVLRIGMGDTVLCLTGWTGHAIDVLFHNGYLLICNRGDASRKPIEAYRIDVGLMTTALLREFCWNDVQDYLTSLPTTLQKLNATKDPVCEALEVLNPMREFQAVGNCGFESIETALYGLLAIDALLQTDGRDEANAAAMVASFETFQAFSQHLRLEVLEQFLTRLASEAALHQSASVHKMMKDLFALNLEELAKTKEEAAEVEAKETLRRLVRCRMAADLTEEEMDSCRARGFGALAPWRLATERRYGELKALYHNRHRVEPSQLSLRTAAQKLGFNLKTAVERQRRT